MHVGSNNPALTTNAALAWYVSNSRRRDGTNNGELLELWSGNGWQFVRYERAGHANAFLVMSDDTTHTLNRATMWFR